MLPWRNIDCNDSVELFLRRMVMNRSMAVKAFSFLIFAQHAATGAPTFFCFLLIDILKHKILQTENCAMVVYSVAFVESNRFVDNASLTSRKLASKWFCGTTTSLRNDEKQNEFMTNDKLCEACQITAYEVSRATMTLFFNSSEFDPLTAINNKRRHKVD